MPNRLLVRAGLVLLVALRVPSVAHAQTGRPLTLSATRADASGLRVLDQQVDQMIRSRDLRVRTIERDALLITFTATDDAGRPIVFSTPRTALLTR